MGIKYVADRHGSDNRERRRDAVDSAFLLDPPSAPDHRVLHSAKRRPTQTRERRRAAVDSSFLLDSLIASDHDALPDTAAEPPRQAAKRRPPQTSEGSAAAEQPTVGPRRAVHARPLKALGPVRLPHDWEQAPPTSGGVSSAPGISAPGGAKYARSVRRKRRAVLWVICAIVLLASLLLVLWYAAAPGIFSL
jgi:hypothetical protein